MSHSGGSDSKMGHIRLSQRNLHMLTMQCMYMCEGLWTGVTSAQVLDAHTHSTYLMHCMMHVLYHILSCTACYLLCMIIHLTAKVKKQDCNGKEAHRKDRAMGTYWWPSCSPHPTMLISWLAMGKATSSSKIPPEYA